jgi:hypothetical protein
MRYDLLHSINKILLLLTLLAIELIPNPVSPLTSGDILQLCLAGIKEKRGLTELSSLRSIGVSKILKAELNSLAIELSKEEIIPETLSSHGLALTLIMDLTVPDIHPICLFLQDFDHEDEWKTLSAIAGSLEKSTQSKVLTGLTREDISVFKPILEQGLSTFESDCNSSFCQSYHSLSSKRDSEFPSSLYQSNQFK